MKKIVLISVLCVQICQTNDLIPKKEKKLSIGQLKEQVVEEMDLLLHHSTLTMKNCADLIDDIADSIKHIACGDTEYTRQDLENKKVQVKALKDAFVAWLETYESYARR